MNIPCYVMNIDSFLIM